MKSFKQITEEVLNEGDDRYPADDMTMSELKIAINAAQNILDMLEDGAMIQRWQISAIVKASDELASVCTNMRADFDSELEDEEEWLNGYDEEDEEPMYVGYEYPSMYREETELDEAVDKDHPIVKEYHALKKNDIKTLRNMIAGQRRISDVSEFRSKDHAVSAILRDKYGHKKVDKAFGFNEEAELDEQIKGWKNAGRDLAKWRSAQGKDVKLVSLKKDGTESKMHDASKMFRSEDEAQEHHERITKLNPKSKIRHNLYIDGKHVKTLGEEVELDEAGAFSYGAKSPRKGSIAYNAMMMRKQQEKNQKPIEPKDQMVGNAKVTKEEVELDEISYRDSGARNMLRADQKAEREVAKMRAQAAKEAAKKKPVEEEVEQIDELSKNTLKKYRSAAWKSAGDHYDATADAETDGEHDYHMGKGDKRMKGYELATAKTGLKPHQTYANSGINTIPKAKVKATNSKVKKVAEETDYKVTVDGLPDMYVKADSPSDVKNNLRKVVKNPEMIRGVERVAKATLQKIFRDKSVGKEE